MKTSGMFVTVVVALTLVHLWSDLPTAQAATQADLYNLFNYLFGVYQKEIIPLENDTNIVSVFLSFSLLSLVDVNEKDQTLVSNALLHMSWLDNTLTWSPSQYGNVTSLLVHQENIWRPDIQVGNSVILQKQMGFDELPVRVMWSGLIEWEPTTVMSTSCDIDVTYYPMDTQVCNIDFETSLSRSTEIDVQIDKTVPITLDDYNVDGQWELKDTYAENLNKDDGKTKIRFSLLLKRRRTYYVVNILLPVVFLSFTSTLVFALPAEAGEKMSMGITVLLAYAVYLTIVSEHLPNTSVQTSIVAVYLTTLLGITAVGIMVSTLILRLHHRSAGARVDDRTQKLVEFLKTITFSHKEEDKQIPKNSISPEDPMLHDKGYKNFQLSYMDANNSSRGQTATIVKRKSRLSDLDKNSGTTDHSKLEPEQTRMGLNRPISCPPVYHKPMTWQEVAEVADWFLFILFTTLTSLLTLTVLIVLPVGGDSRAPTLNKTLTDTQ
ncbi:neuronal acetylcholine receptor subunit alpha-3 [Elysia marginata]|uniref:Neuronal acetylcholine receptor subunit alpha-3 n=1 Tax=Elysia marginata TaxID=1093978 RepID=A0AAV4I0J6_9GAST|nr:neuronal acetylcholine receptor subunit alpha-3 [Elysia marginata]